MQVWKKILCMFFIITGVLGNCSTQAIVIDGELLTEEGMTIETTPLDIEWLVAQIENIEDKEQMLQDIITGMYIINTTQIGPSSAGAQAESEILYPSVVELCAWLDTINVTYMLDEKSDYTSIWLSNNVSIHVSMEDDHISAMELYLHNIEGAYSDDLCVNVVF